MERTFVSCTTPLHRLGPTSRAHRRWNGHKEGGQTVFFTPLDPIGDETEEEYDDLTSPRKAHKNKWTSSQDAISWVNLGKHLIEDCSLGKPDLTPSSFMTQCQLTALKKWDKHQRRQDFCTKGFQRHDLLRELY